MSEQSDNKKDNKRLEEEGLNAKSPEEKLIYYNKFLELNPNDERAWEFKGDAFANIGRFEDARNCYIKVLNLNPDNTKVRLKAIEISPNNGMLWLQKGIFLSKFKEYEEALNCINKALEIDIKNEIFWMHKGSVLCILEKYQEALKCYEKALEINPTNTKVKWKILEIDPENEELWIHKGIAFFNLEDYIEALKCYDKALEINPINYESWYEKGKTHSHSREYVKAIKCYDKAIELNPNNEMAWEYKAEALVNLERVEDAIKCYDKVIELNPNSERAWEYKAEALVNLKRFENAIKCYDKAIELNPNNERAWEYKAEALVNLERFEDAIECYDKALEINPKNYKSWYEKGKTHSHSREYVKAIKCYDKAIKLNPNSERAWEYKGDALVNLKRLKDGIKCYDKAIELNPDSEMAWEYKGKSLINLERFEDGIKCYDKALQLNPNNRKVKLDKNKILKRLEKNKQATKLYDEGQNLRNVGKYKKALICYNKALEIDPENEKIWVCKGFALCKLEKYLEAKKCCEKALEINKKNEIAWNYIGNIFYILEWYDDSRKSYDESLEINSKNEKTWCGKGKAHYKLSEYGTAIKCYDQALEIDPRYEKVWVNKGIALCKLEKYEEALICYNKALELNSEDEIAWYNKGFVFHRLDNNEDAIGCYDQALNLNPENENVWEWKGIAFCKLDKYEDAIDCYDNALHLNQRNENAWKFKGIALCELGKYEEAIKCYDTLIELNPLNINWSKNREKAILSYEDQLHDTIVSKFRTCFRLEPPKLGECSIKESLSAQWSLRYFIQDLEDRSLIISAKKVWDASGDTLKFFNHRYNNPKALLLYDLKKASDLFPPIKDSLQTSKPVEVKITTKEAYLFLKEKVLLFKEMGFEVKSPPWWEQNSVKTKLCKKLNINPFSESNIVNKSFSFDKIIEYNWKLAIGDEQISEEEFEMIVRLKEPMIYFIRGQWIELKEKEIQAAVKFLESGPDNKMNLLEVIRLTIGDIESDTILPSIGYDAPRGLIDLIEMLKSKNEIPNIGNILELSQPCGFVGNLYPYQIKGYSWLALLRDYRLGACLADDMGLGKTIQMLALLLKDKENGVDKPTLLICPTSVVWNWKTEADKFAPSLKIMPHSGIARKKKNFLSRVQNTDLVITNYALAHRDEDLFSQVHWNGIVLDEAQKIKNHFTKQSQAIRKFRSEYRVALTGTPVENRLRDLWSILDFLNPGYLGSAESFRKKFALPIEKNKDKEVEINLKKLISPFILRRMKTDPNIRRDLPDKREMKEHCNLTKEQGTLYEAFRKEMQEEIKESEGIKRKSIVLNTIRRLKQICNHPAHFLGDGSSLSGRSGKLIRITEMLEEVLAEDDAALVFTQYKKMGDMLKMHFEEVFDQEVLFLNGEVPPEERQQMVMRFSENNGPKIFVLTVQAGGLGMNLTRASHVFHFDRWWNPAVENQATDRAFRIGQKKNVLVHKFICNGTFEEKIDQMIEDKKALAENIIGTGEICLTEMTDEQLKEIFTLREEAVSDEYE